MEEKKKYTAQDIQVYLNNANDRIEVAVNEGNYYEDYVVEHAKNHTQEMKILTQLATHFRGQGFRVKIYQSEAADYGKRDFTFLRIGWCYNPYHYPEETSSVLSSITSFLSFGRKKKKKTSSQPDLFGFGREAYQKVKEKDTLTEEVIRLMEDFVGKATVSGNRNIVIKRAELKSMVKGIQGQKQHLLRKIDTYEILRFFEKKGYRVKIKRMFQFEFSRAGRVD